MASFSVLPRLRGIKILSACLLYLVDSLPSTVLAPLGRLRQPLPSGPVARLPSFLFPQSLRGRTGIGSFPEECLWAACGSLLPWPGCARPSRKRGRSAPSNLFAEAYAGGWESMALCRGRGQAAAPLLPCGPAARLPIYVGSPPHPLWRERSAPRTPRGTLSMEKEFPESQPREIPWQSPPTAYLPVR